MGSIVAAIFLGPSGILTAWLGLDMMRAALREGARPRAERDEARGFGLWMCGSVFMLFGLGAAVSSILLFGARHG